MHLSLGLNSLPGSCVSLGMLLWGCDETIQIFYIIWQYFRATIKDKIFQLRFLEEINPDDGKAERSGTTGHLVIKLARVHFQKKRKSKDSKKTMESKLEMEERKLLEVTPSNMDFSQIVKTEENDGSLLEMPPLEYISD